MISATAQTSQVQMDLIYQSNIERVTDFDAASVEQDFVDHWERFADKTACNSHLLRNCSENRVDLERHQVHNLDRLDFRNIPFYCGLYTRLKGHG